MGFGFGTKTKQYRISPGKLAGGSSKASIRLLDVGDRRLIYEYYNQLMEKHYGVIKRTELEVERSFEDKKKMAGYLKNGRLEGYLTFFFQPDSRGKYQIHVTEFFYSHREALAELHFIRGNGRCSIWPALSAFEGGNLRPGVDTGR